VPLDNQPNIGLNMSKQIAKTAATGSPSIKTFVIGVVDTGDFISSGNLNQLAASGGTDKALIIKPNQDMAAQFAVALEAIKGQAIGCEFKLPSNDAGKIDTDKVNGRLCRQRRQRRECVRRQHPAGLRRHPWGWYYDDPADPTSILLCPATCTEVQKPGQKVDVNIQNGVQDSLHASQVVRRSRPANAWLSVSSHVRCPTLQRARRMSRRMHMRLRLFASLR